MDLATPTLHRTGANSYGVSHGDDSLLWIEFSMEAVHQTAESEKEGRPIYKEVPYITIRFPGDKTRELHRPVRFKPDESAPHPPDPERFPRQWTAFQARGEQAHDGTPIEQWPPLNKSMVMELKSMHIHTVEQLVNIPDAALHTLGMGGRDLREKARAWLGNAQDGSEVIRLAAENAELKADLEIMKRQIADLAQARTEDQPRRGRPPKSQED